MYQHDGQSNIFSLACLDRMILQQIDRAQAEGITAWEIEQRLRAEIGNCVHQSVTGNLRHLVERRRVVKTSELRLVANEWRHVYVSPEFHSAPRHGPALLEPRRQRRGRTDAELNLLRRRIACAQPGTALHRILETLGRCSTGLTCRELEQRLGLSHQSVSARLTELDAAAYIRKTGTKRRQQGDRRSLSVYKVIEHETATLFDDI